MKNKTSASSGNQQASRQSTVPKHQRQGSHQWSNKPMPNIKPVGQQRQAVSVERQQTMHEQIESEDERSPPNFQNLFKNCGKLVQQFPKTHSEPDFLTRDALKNNQNLLGSLGGNRIQLIVRIRPFLSTEQIKECLKVVNENGIRLFKEYHQIHFKFDNILMPNDSQDVVFSKIANISRSFLLGMNGTIFAYGQTGAGKTYSIIGEENNGFDVLHNQKRGILPHALDFVFDKLHGEDSQLKNIKLAVSFFEIYNEKIYDLLSIAPKKGPVKARDGLELREEKDGYFNVVDLKKVGISTIEEAYGYLEKGLQKRATSSTSLNNKSSRSHSIFQLYLEKENDEGVVIRSKLRIVDLAGSEKYMIKKDLPPSEKNLKVQELTSINSSLSALGQCISALADPTRKHIPYRNSKLTKVLKDSLDEKSHVALIICISPSVDSYKETLSTLQFADRAKKAILDGRNFSDSKLLGNQGSHEGVNNVMKAYQEEKAIRRELEKYMKDNFKMEVMEELEKLKKQNKELQDKVSNLEKCKPKHTSPLKGCLKKRNQAKKAKPQVEDPESPRRVRFAIKLDNDDSLDSDTRERIEHNLKYNDDTIFDNISIFRDVNNSGQVPNKLVDKEVHPSLLKEKYPINKDEEEEKEQVEEVKVPQMINKLSDKSIKHFWAVPTKEKARVSPIKREKTNTSSQDLSKDLLDFESDKILTPAARYSGSVSAADKTIGTSKSKSQRRDQPLPIKSDTIEIQEELQQSQGEGQLIEDQQDSSEGNSPKGYHVCDSSEQFFEGDFSVNQGMPEPILSDSIMEAGLEEEGNGSGDNQNTLLLDSQSIIIEGGDVNNQHNKDANLSQQMHSLEASDIMQQKEIHHKKHPSYFSVNANQPYQSLGGPPSSNQNTDVLTYSLTNTFTTIESLHDELAAIKSGLEVSHKKGTNILETIQKYAREIEENKFSDDEEENVKSNNDSLLDKDYSHLEEENLNFIKDIKGFYSKIHEEIAQLKTILIETPKNKNSSQFKPRMHCLTDKVPPKYDPLIKSESESTLNNVQTIEGTQRLIDELKREMTEILIMNQDTDKPEIKRRSIPPLEDKGGSQTPAIEKDARSTRSLRVIELLENLEQSLLQQVIPSVKKSQQELKAATQHSPSFKTESHQKSSAVTKTKDNGSDSKHNVSHSPTYQTESQLIQLLQPLEQIPSQKDDRSSTPSQFKQLSNKRSPRSQKNIVQYEEMPSFNASPGMGLLEENQRTPEVFKSLSKLNDSDSYAVGQQLRGGLKQQQQIKSNMIKPNFQGFFQGTSSQNSENTPKNQRQTLDNQDFQITLRQQQQPSTSLDRVNQSKTKSKKHNADNTLTLIFDSEDDQGDTSSNQPPKDREEQDSFFNDENSKIERGSIQNSMQIQNSFQGDSSSLIFLANDLSVKENAPSKFQKKENKQNHSYFINERDEQDFSDSQELINTSKNNIFSDKLGAKGDHQDQHLPSIYQQNPNKATKGSTSMPSIASLAAERLNLDENGSTSKQSVLKYWNKFFNKDTQNQNHPHDNQQIKKSAYKSHTSNEGAIRSPQMPHLAKDSDKTGSHQASPFYKI